MFFYKNPNKHIYVQEDFSLPTAHLVVVLSQGFGHLQIFVVLLYSFVAKVSSKTLKHIIFYQKNTIHTFFHFYLL